jgi:hypothetical protein
VAVFGVFRGLAVALFFIAELTMGRKERWGPIALAEDLSNIYEVVHERFNFRLARYSSITT